MAKHTGLVRVIVGTTVCVAVGLSATTASAQWTLSLPPPVQTASYFAADNIGREVAEENSNTENDPIRSKVTAPVSSLTYTPSSSRTRANMQAFIAHAEKQNPGNGAQLQLLVNSMDVIGTVSGAINQLGLDPNNVADVYAIYWIVYWGLANRYYDDPSPASYRAVANQAARGFASSPEFVASSDADKQKMAEELMLNILYFSSIAEEAKTNKAVADQFAKASMEGSRKSGLELDKMTLTEDGFVPKSKTTGG
ncbi:DUF6683 family protein [Sphingorhabdus arenilitoris]|uniref:DUF6683 family protein n=1 Tax=Sphingorhabdus arenilitoris TaxID=1490041 RepID=A0ABV8RKU4_9SPHN